MSSAVVSAAADAETDSGLYNDADTVGLLASLGLTDAEQLVAVAAIPGMFLQLSQTLGIGENKTGEFVGKAQQALTAERLVLVKTPAPRDLTLGALPPTPETLAEMEAQNSAVAVTIPLVALASSVNLIPYMNPVRNQAARGTCVSFALTALNEYVQRRKGHVVDLSEQFLYYQTKLIDGNAGGCGTFQAKAVLPLFQIGECPEAIWPYNPNGPCNNHGVLPPNATAAAAPYRLQTLAVSARDVNAYKAAFARQQLVTCSIPVYNSWYLSAETRRSGRITLPIGNEVSTGGHAICLVGYQDDPNSPGGGYFIVRNSWNGLWATQSPYGVGYGAIPYQYVTNLAWEAFTAPIPAITVEDDSKVTAGKKIVIEVDNVRITIS